MVFDGLGGRKVVFRRAYCECEQAQAAKNEAEKAEAAKELEKRVNGLTAYAGINIGRYARMTFDNFDTGRHKNAGHHRNEAMRYSLEVQPGQPNLLFMHGPYGAGKTHLAVAILHSVILYRIDDNWGNGWSAYFADWTEHCSAVQQSWDRDKGEAGPSESKLWGSMRNCSILVIDDLDKRQPGEWAMGKLFEVVQHRYIREKPMVITANHSLEQLAEIWQGSNKAYIRDIGGAILSRFMGQLWGQLHVNGPDQRASE